MGIFDFLKPKPKVSPEQVLQRAILLSKLQEHTKGFTESSSPVEVKIGIFLMLGAERATNAAGITDPDRNPDVAECAALLMVIQQGIHTFLTMARGDAAISTPAYRESWASLFALSAASVFGFDVNDPDERGIAIMREGTRITKIAQRQNVTLLQEIFDAWEKLLLDFGDQRVAQMSVLYERSIVWARTNSVSEQSVTHQPT